MATRVSYPVEVKMKAIEMRLAGILVKIALEELNIKIHSQLKTCMKWHREGAHKLFYQPVGKHYAYGKGTENESETVRL